MEQLFCVNSTFDRTEKEIKNDLFVKKKDSFFDDMIRDMLLVKR